MMKTNSRTINSIEYVFPIDHRQVKEPDPIVEGIIQEGKIDNGLASIGMQLALQHQGVVVDVGCHIGIDCLQLASYGRHSFIAIDGSKESITCLKKSIDKNNLNNIEPVHAVVSHSNFKCSFAKFAHSKNIIFKAMGFFRGMWVWRWFSKMKTKTLDEIIGDTHCGTIKIDVEGYEVAVLHGAAKTIMRDRPNLLIKIDPSYQHVDMILDTLHELDYDAYYFHPADLNHPTPLLAEIKEPCEECAPTFALCFAKGFDITPRFRLFKQDIQPTGTVEVDASAQLLQDIVNEKPVPLHISSQENNNAEGLAQIKEMG